MGVPIIHTTMAYEMVPNLPSSHQVNLESLGTRLTTIVYDARPTARHQGGHTCDASRQFKEDEETFVYTVSADPAPPGSSAN